MPFVEIGPKGLGDQISAYAICQRRKLLMRNFSASPNQKIRIGCPAV
jgi:hypothetical protein